MKNCFQCDTAYENFKDLPTRTASDKILLDKAFNIVKNRIQNMFDIKEVLLE